LLALAQDQVQKAEACFARGLALNPKHLLGQIPSMLWYLGTVAWVKGENALAAERFEELLTLSQEANHPGNIAFALFGLGRAALDRGDLPQARAYLVQALKNCEEFLDSPWDIIYTLESLAYVELRSGKIEQAVRLLGTTQAYHQRFENLRTRKEREMRNEALEAARRLLDEADFTAAWETGRALSPKDAATDALRECRTDG
jgi:tetratricopeptide (TPR) repeat protein